MKMSLLRGFLLVLAVLSLSGVVVGVVSHAVEAQGKGGGSAGGPFGEILSLLKNPVFGLEEIKTEVRNIEDTVLNIEDKVDRLEISVAVAERVCSSGAIQCGNGGTGHTFADASSTNHNLIAIRALVTLNGSPVAGLTAADFSFSNQFVPAGGPAAALCPGGGAGCAAPGDHFQEAASPPVGLYGMYAHPVPGGGFNWKAGTYFATLAVDDGMGHTASALVDWTMPQ